MNTPDTTGTRTVGIEFQAVPLLLLVMRRVIDEIVQIDQYSDAERDDLRLAIHETAALSVLDAVPGSPVICQFRRNDREVGVCIRSVAADEIHRNSHRLSWYTLRSLIPSARMAQHPFDDALGGCRTVTQFTWRRRNPEDTRRLEN